tara:strand:+ start:207 stop:470 length:264 start_codon:yes stop_codon:yes gene_type:complete
MRLPEHFASVVPHSTMLKKRLRHVMHMLPARLLRAALWAGEERALALTAWMPQRGSGGAPVPHPKSGDYCTACEHAGTELGCGSTRC